MLTEEEIVKGNKVIAKYDGHTIDFGYNKDGVLFLGQHIDVRKLMYHTSWNWLIPVCRKCLESHSALIDGREIIETPYALIASELVEGYDIERVWKAVIEFIEWYNNLEIDNSDIYEN